MKGLTSSRNLPATLIAMLALIVAATGVAVAVPGAHTSKVTVVKVRRIATQVADAEIASKVKPAVTTQINNIAPTLTVGNATTLGGVPPSGFQRTLRAAVIQYNPSTVTTSVVSGNATFAGRLGAGYYYADFPADVRGCTPLAGLTGPEPGFATANVYSGSDPNAVAFRAFPYNSTGSPDDPPSTYTFNVVVVC
jgi:hypothetical protein